MARNNNKLTKAQRTILLNVPAGVNPGDSASGYVDSGQSLSIVNRKLFSQKKCYAISDIQFAISPSVAYDTIIVVVSTAGDTWSVHNAWTKSHALHTEMQDLVLDDNPSVKGTWAEFKVFLDGEHRNAVNGAGAPGNLQPFDGAGNLVLDGEWDYSTFVMPQHDVDPATGEPLAADETNVHLLGPNLGASGALLSAGLVEAYSLSRATVQPEDPSVPAGMGDSFFNLLTDSGSQEPELALVIEGENDEPPYDQLSYPGGGANAPVPFVTAFDTANTASPNGIINGFIAQCGLFKITTSAFLNGEKVASPEVSVLVNYAPGTYKGVAAIDMGQ